VLTDVNFRLSGSVEIALRTGVGSLERMYAWAAGEELTSVDSYRIAPCACVGCLGI
jgi:hypothetical protein